MRKKKKQQAHFIQDKYPGVRALRARNRLKSNYFFNAYQQEEVKRSQEALSSYRSNNLKKWLAQKFDYMFDDAIEFFNQGSEYARRDV
ncbi:MAG: hypothetical protein U5Q03_03555 [Bacteroidota bacterium]|nr:hypothetical protein [Bacteroidota bacterium]